MHRYELKKKTKDLIDLGRWHFGDEVFIHINKCGGSSCSKALGYPYISHFFAETVIDCIGLDSWKKKKSFAIVRDPTDRVLSMFFYHLKINKVTYLGYEQFQRFISWLERYNRLPSTLKGQMFRTQKEWLLHRNEVAVARTFSLSDEDLWRKLSDYLERDVQEKRIKTTGKPIDFSLQPLEKAKILSIFQEDFEMIKNVN